MGTFRTPNLVFVILHYKPLNGLAIFYLLHILL